MNVPDRLDRARGLRTRWCGELSGDDLGQQVSVCGWVSRRREHSSHLAFLDVRDRTGIIQCVIDTSLDLKSEYVVQVTGTVSPRPEGTENHDLATGNVELTSCVVDVLNRADTPPFSIHKYAESDETVRLRYRYLDLRRDRMLGNLVLRSKINTAARAAMVNQGFVEVETPLLWTPTPEGAREFAVPSRLQKGAFYVLPQSPQIAKQLLMVAGVDRYFQIAKCLRDEDLRSDRQFEFTQLDLEASFVSATDIIEIVNEVIRKILTEVMDNPEFSISILSWRAAMDRFGSDKPDMRFGMELKDLSEVFSKTSFRAFEAPCVKAIVLQDGASLSRSRLDNLTIRSKELGAQGLVWIKVLPDENSNLTTVTGDKVVLESPISKFLSDAEKSDLVQVLEVNSGDLILAVAGEYRITCECLGQLRLEVGRPGLEEHSLIFVWVVDFPMFDGRDDQGNLQAAHHPFTMPHTEDLDLLDSDPLAVRSQAYDLVLNGWELGSGSIRIHSADIQSKVFRTLGISPEQAEERFGFLLSAFKYGAPPHGGFAVGMDRLVALLAKEDNIREVIAFPKTQSGQDLMTGAPKELSTKNLAELGIGVSGKAN